jgi:putative ABC transport system permease protein
MRSLMTLLRRVTGMGLAGSLALAVLCGGCVLAASSGPRQPIAADMRGVAEALDPLPELDKTVVVKSTLDQMGLGAPIFTSASLAAVTAALRADFGGGPLTLAPQSAEWAGVATGEYPLVSYPDNGSLPALGQTPANIEIDYRDPVSGHLRLVAGSMPDSTPPTLLPTINVVVTQQTATVFGLTAGSRVMVVTPFFGFGNQNQPYNTVILDITGIVEPVDPSSTFWRTDTLLAAPSLVHDPVAVWEGAFIADPGELFNLQQIFGQLSLSFQWERPVDTAALHVEAQALLSQLNQMTSEAPGMSGAAPPIGNALNVSSGLVAPLANYVQAINDVSTLLWMVYAGLAAAVLVMLLLAARMIAARRAGEMALLRARGASLVQVIALGSLGAAVACGPAAALAWVAAVRLDPHAAPGGAAAWWPGAATVAVAVFGPGLIAAWQHRLPRRRADRRQGRWTVRVIVEGTACLAAIGAIMVLRSQAGASDLYTSAAPVLVAVPAVIVVLRLYQLLLGWLARAAARQRGLSGFLGLTRAARATAALALPAMTLVLALTMVAFTSMVREAVTRGETLSSWQETGADAVITPSTLQAGMPVFTASAAAAITAVPGVQHAATVLVVPMSLASGTVTAIAVGPASYAALVASEQGFSSVRPALLTPARGQDVTPVLASPQAAAILGGRVATGVFGQPGLPTVRVQVAGELQSTPALPAGGAFVVLPQSAISHAGQAPPGNLMLLTGPSIDMTSLDAVVHKVFPGAYAPSVATRAAALQALAGAPIQQGTFDLFTLSIVFAAALALAVMILGLALGAADREATMARLATMGLTEGVRVRLTLLEVLPSITAAAVATVVCATTLPRLVAPAIDLSVFTQSQAPAGLRPDFTSFLLPLVLLVLVTILALAYEIRRARRHAAAAMRI